MAIRDVLASYLIGQDPLDNERLWDAMYYGNIQAGRKGVILRGISAVDIALWDIKGKVAGLPLYKLLGGRHEKVPVYISGGYYRKDKGLKELQEEMESYAAQGYKAVKMRVGMLPLKEDLKRIQVTRKAMGDEAHLMLDAEYSWQDAGTAIRCIKAYEEYNPYWIEGPTELNKVLLHTEIAGAVNTPIATGGQEYTRWGFLELIRNKACSILQPDAVVVGGITEWLKVAHIADGYDLKSVPSC